MKVLKLNQSRRSLALLGLFTSGLCVCLGIAYKFVAGPMAQQPDPKRDPLLQSRGQHAMLWVYKQ
jgi:hypothetical protein